MNLIYEFLQFIYKLFILEVKFLDKNTYDCKFCKPFGSLSFNTNNNDRIVFNFLIDEYNKKLIYKKFIVEIEISDGFNSMFKLLNEKITVVCKLFLLPINYKLLSKILFDLYLQQAYDYINSKLKK